MGVLEVRVSGDRTRRVLALMALLYPDQEDDRLMAAWFMRRAGMLDEEKRDD